MSLASTSLGVGIAPNSVIYLSAARSLESGRGFIALNQQGGLAPLTHYPPLLSILLAAGGWLGITVETAARWLNALAFGASTCLVGGLIHRCSGSAARALAGSFLFLTALQSLEMYSFLLSEPIFIALLLLSVVALARHIETWSRRHLLWAAAAAALAFLDRYAGAAFAGAWTLAIFLFGAAPRARRIKDALLFGCIVAAPLAIWIAHNELFTESAVHRPVVYHAMGLGQLRKALETTAGWVAPLSVPFLFQAVLAAAVAGGLAAAWLAGRRGGRSDPGRREPATILDLAALGIAAYVAMLVFSINFVDAATPLSRRILSPVFALGLVLAFGGIRIGARGGRGRAVRVAAWSLVVALCVFNAARAGRWVLEARRTGLGYASVAWRRSELIRRVEQLPDDLAVATNAVEVVYYLGGRVSTELPSRTNKYSKVPVPTYQDDLDALVREVKAGRTAVVYVNGLAREHLIDIEEIEARLGPPADVVQGEGEIFRRSPSAVTE